MKSKLRWTSILFQFTMGCALTYFAYQQLLINNEFGFLDSGEDKISLLIGFMGLLSFIFLMDYKVVIVGPESIEKRTLLGFPTKKLDRKRIREYSEIKTENEFMTNRELILFADQDCIRISSFGTKNYDELKREVITDIERRAKYEERSNRILYRFGVGLLIIVILGAVLLAINN